MRNEIHDPKVNLVVSTKNDVEDHLFGDEFIGVGGSAGDPGEYAADMVDAQWSAKSKTARALLSGSGLGPYPVG